MICFYLQGMERLEEIFNREGKAVDDLLNVAKVTVALNDGMLDYDWIVFIFFSVFSKLLLLVMLLGNLTVSTDI